MFSTICLLFLCGFILWMNTSKRIAWPGKSQLLVRMAATPAYGRYAAGALFIAATVLCTISLGMGSGIFAALIVLMAAGSVSVLFFPFHYVGAKGIAIVYICALALELIIR